MYVKHIKLSESPHFPVNHSVNHAFETFLETKREENIGGILTMAFLFPILSLVCFRHERPAVE
jgi:hypothetical protein